MDDSSRRQGTRVFKKSSPNGKITVYLGKRDFVDHVTHVDPIDGVVLIDPDYLKDRNRKVYGQVLAAFRYGREDLDVLGLTFRKDLFFATSQIFPTPTADDNRACSNLSSPSANASGANSGATGEPRQPTRLQERLMKKLGPNAYPFYFELPPNCPASVTLQPAPGDTGKPCGIDYELRAFVAETPDEKLHKRNSVRLAIRKVMYAPSKQGEQPYMEVSKEFMMCPNKLHLEASLDKELYYHGETINVNVHVQNNSNRSVKKIKISVRQFADICLFSSAQYKCTVAELESEEGCPVTPGFNLSKVYSLRPSVAGNKYKRCLALDGQLKHEDTNLASSTYFPVNTPSQREHMAIVVQYKVKVKLCLGALGGDLVAELPFMLMHPKPPDESNASPCIGGGKDPITGGGDAAGLAGAEKGDDSTGGATANGDATATSADNDLLLPETNLIQLDDPVQEEPDDIIFEDFARLRLKGETDA